MKKRRLSRKSGPVDTSAIVPIDAGAMRRTCYSVTDFIKDLVKIKKSYGYTERQWDRQEVFARVGNKLYKVSSVNFECSPTIHLEFVQDV